MKKILFIVCIIFCQSMLMGQNYYEASFYQNRRELGFALPYESDRILSRVFREDAILALEIQAVYVDGEEIFRQCYGIGELQDWTIFIKTQWNWRRKTQFFINLSCSKYTSLGESQKKAIRLADVREAENCYIIYEGSKELLIHYKVIAPFRDMTEWRIMQKDVPDDAYIGEYWAKADLTEVFASF